MNCFPTIILGRVAAVVETSNNTRCIYNIEKHVPGREWPVRISVFGPSGLAERGQMVCWSGLVERRGVARKAQQGQPSDQFGNLVETVDGQARVVRDFITNVSFLSPLDAEAYSALEDLLREEYERYASCRAEAAEAPVKTA